MTIEDLPRLTPRQRRVAQLIEFEGLTAAQAAARLGGKWTRNAVAACIYQARHRLKTNFVPWKKSGLCLKGHPLTDYGRYRRCKTCAKAARQEREDRAEERGLETRAKVHARVMREVASGIRCAYPMRKGPCCLLLPCGIHDSTTKETT